MLDSGVNRGKVDRGVRVNLTLPPVLHRVVQNYAAATGQTLAGAVTDLVRQVGVPYARRWLAGEVLADTVRSRGSTAAAALWPRPSGAASSAEKSSSSAPKPPAAPAPSRPPAAAAEKPDSGPGDLSHYPPARPPNRAERRAAKAQKRKSAGR